MKVIAKAGSPVVRSGPYAGGIGAGGFEVRPDGKFCRCHIWNEWSWEAVMDATFYHRDRRGNIRQLKLGDDIHAGKVIPGIPEIRMDALFPTIKVEYPSVGVKIEYSSFFIPGDLKNSSLPAVSIRVQGEGELVFMLSDRFPANALVRRNEVFMEGREGGIGMASRRGRAFSVPGWGAQWTINSWIAWKKGFQVKSKSDSRVVRRTGGLHWSGKFNDEFVLAWSYPVNRDNTGKPMGHWYNRYFKDARAVARYVRSNLGSLKSRTAKFTESIRRGPGTPELKETYSSQLFSFVKQSWLTKDGKFGEWEGSCSCCGVQTTDVSYYGSWIYFSLFPMLEESGIKLTRKFQRKDGWIPHYFPGTFSRIDEYRRKDMNMQYVLMVWRDYLKWKDKGFLKEMWPSFKKAILGVYSWDKDGDGIPEVEGSAQTFDCWGFSGTSSFIAILWMAALRVGSGAARQMGDYGFALRCESDLNRVRHRTIRTLWNGKYFDLAVDGKKKDNCCMLDTLSGDWYCRLMGLGGILPDSMVVSHLKSCLKMCRKRMDPKVMGHYYTPGEEGWYYANGAYPDGHNVCFQQVEPWTGIEYSFAIHLALMGMRKESLRVVKDVHDRKARCGMVWNHIECGGDYFRPMMIGGLWDLLAGRLPIKRK